MKSVSILGDSISTFEGFNPNGYSVFYTTEQQYKNGLKSVEDTWWYRVIKHLNAELCINNSFSGSRVSGDVFPAANSNERISALRRGSSIPDIVIIYIGFNDFGNGVAVKNGKIFTNDSLSFEGAYKIMIERIKREFPSAKIICSTLCRTKIVNKPMWEFPETFHGVALEEYNNMIRKVVKAKKCCLADVSSYGQFIETLDGSHPNFDGHKILSELWIHSISNI